MATVVQLLERARKYIGTPYKFGGSTPSEGFDCSGFMNYIFNSFGYKIGRTTYQQITQGKRITQRVDLKAGEKI